MAEPTNFAPAERAEVTDVQRSASQVTELDRVVELLDAVPDVYLILNRQRQVIFANDALVDLLNLESREKAVGQRPGEILHCEHASESDGGCGTTTYCSQCGAIRAIMHGLRGKAAVEDCHIMQADGEALDLRIWARPFKLDNEDHCIFALKDISDEKRRRALERTFFHDVLNTAGILSTYTEILSLDPNEIYGVSGELSKVAHRLIDEIITHKNLLAAETGELAVFVEELYPGEVLYDVAAAYRQHPVAEGRTIDIETMKDSISFTSDRTLLGRVIGNMVKNALEACHPDECVSMAFAVSDDAVLFEVNNPGVMPRKAELQVFKRSFSTKGVGRGLGTYSMKLLSEKYLHGSVGFRTNDDDGTTFFVSLPLAWPEAQD